MKMITPASKLGWGGSLGSLNLSKKHPHKNSKDSGLYDNSRNGTPKMGHRKKLRKRFHSLTEGLSAFFTPEKKAKEVGRRSCENVGSSSHASFSEALFREKSVPLSALSSSSVDDRSGEYSSRHRAASFSSFRPPKNKTPDTPKVIDKKKTSIGTETKNAPPRPPPRRYSFWISSSSDKTEKKNTHSATIGKLSTRNQNKHESIHSTLPSSPMNIYSSPKSSMNSRPLPQTNNNANKYKHKASSPTSQSIPSPSLGSAIEKTVSIVLQKENGTFGFTLRGGLSPKGLLRPLLVTHVRPGGPADREGSMKVGDRISAVDGRDVRGYSLADAHVVIQEIHSIATFAIRYDVSIMDTVRSKEGPLLVEIERTPGSCLGVTLNTFRFSHSLYKNNNISDTLPPKRPNNAVIIERIRTASIAERCGVLAVGDVVNAIDGLRLGQGNLEEANNVLSIGNGHKVTLEVIPNRRIARVKSGIPVLSSPSSAHRISSYSTLNNRHLPNHRNGNRIQGRVRGDNTLPPLGFKISQLAKDNSVVSNRTETFRCTLLCSERNLGLVLRSPLDGRYPIVAAIDPGGSVDKLGVICVGDRILGVNGRCTDGLSVTQVTQMMTNTRPTVIVDVECDIADSVIPSSGVFLVKLSKRQCCLGINVAADKRPTTSEKPHGPILISDIVRGSSSHRSGILEIGDRILTIESMDVDLLSIDQIRQLLDVNKDVVTLKVHKDDLFLDNNYISYTVQLHSNKGELGISAVGSEDPFEPILIGSVAPGSLADQTGAIHVGDRLTFINGVSLRGKPLSEAVRLLQIAKETVTLTILRPKTRGGEARITNHHRLVDTAVISPHALSEDSALESWSSECVDRLQTQSKFLNGRTIHNNHLPKINSDKKIQQKLMRNPTTNGINPNRGEQDNSWNCSLPTHSSDDEESENEGGTDWDKMIADLNEISTSCELRERSILHDSNEDMKHSHPSQKLENFESGPNSNISPFQVGLGRLSKTANEGAYSVTYATTLKSPPSPSSENSCPSLTRIFTVTLEKDPFYEDFGFSVSDGLYEKGVYVNRIRKGGPAYRSGYLMPYDRILQVNDTQTDDFDCCLTVPLIASAGDSLYLKLSRSIGAPPSFELADDLRFIEWIDQDNSK